MPSPNCPIEFATWPGWGPMNAVIGTVHTIGSQTNTSIKGAHMSLKFFEIFLDTTIMAGIMLIASTISAAQTHAYYQQEQTDLRVSEKRTVTPEKEVASADTPVSAKREIPKADMITRPSLAFFESRSLSSSDKAEEVSADTAPASGKRSASGSGWRFAFTPYLFMTGLSGTIGAEGRTADVNLRFRDVLKHFDFGIMGTFAARKGRFAIFSDFMWIKLSEKRDTPGGLFSTGKVGVNMFIWTPAAGYRLYEGKRGSFDVLGGMRLTSVHSSLNFTSGLLPGFDVSQRKTWAAPVIGAHGLLNLSSKFFLSTIFDIGAGFGTHHTAQFYGGAGYRIRPKIALIGGYEYLNNDYSNNSGFIYNATMNGLLLGARFDF